MINNQVAQYVEESYIFFSVGERNYAFKSNHVFAVMQLVELEYPEHLPEYIAGLLEYNNQIIKVVDLRKILNLESGEYNLNSKIIVVKTKNDTFGIIVDNVSEIRKLETSLFNLPPYNIEESFIEGIYTDKDFSSTIINLENIENKINSYSSNDKACSSAAIYMPKDIQSQETLHRRKLHYARKMREIKGVLIESQDTYITFKLKENTCCVKILHVTGFYKYSNIKIINVPCTPDFIKGIVSIKGRYITVIDLLKFTGGKETEITQDTRIVVVEYEDYEIGIITGIIGETIDVDEGVIKVNSENSKNCLTECVIKNKMYLFLDIKKLFSDEKLYIS